jgi:hypothetical protein
MNKITHFFGTSVLSTPGETYSVSDFIPGCYKLKMGGNAPFYSDRGTYF